MSILVMNLKLSFFHGRKYEGNSEECEHTYYHIVRSGVFSIEKTKRLLEYQPKYTCLETIDLAVKSYIDRNLIRVSDN